MVRGGRGHVVGGGPTEMLTQGSLERSLYSRMRIFSAMVGGLLEGGGGEVCLSEDFM